MAALPIGENSAPSSFSSSCGEPTFAQASAERLAGWTKADHPQVSTQLLPHRIFRDLDGIPQLAAGACLHGRAVETSRIGKAPACRIVAGRRTLRAIRFNRACAVHPVFRAFLARGREPVRSRPGGCVAERQSLSTCVQVEQARSTDAPGRSATLLTCADRLAAAKTACGHEGRSHFQASALQCNALASM